MLSTHCRVLDCGTSTGRGYGRAEPEHWSRNFVWAVRYAQTIYHTKSLSLCAGSRVK